MTDVKKFKLEYGVDKKFLEKYAPNVESACDCFGYKNEDNLPCVSTSNHMIKYQGGRYVTDMPGIVQKMTLMAMEVYKTMINKDVFYQTPFGAQTAQA